MQANDSDGMSKMKITAAGANRFINPKGIGLHPDLKRAVHSVGISLFGELNYASDRIDLIACSSFSTALVELWHFSAQIFGSQ